MAREAQEAGDIFWVARQGWKGCGGFFNNVTRDHHPGLVLEDTVSMRQPVLMAPGTRSAPRRGADLPFMPWERTLTDQFEESGHFVLAHAKPVSRRFILDYMDTLSPADLPRLAASVSQWRTEFDRLHQQEIAASYTVDKAPVEGQP